MIHFWSFTTDDQLLSNAIIKVMGEQGEAVVEETAPSGDVGEGTDAGFSNRRLHNYPLIKV